MVKWFQLGGAPKETGDVKGKMAYKLCAGFLHNNYRLSTAVYGVQH